MSFHLICEVIRLKIGQLLKEEKLENMKQSENALVFLKGISKKWRAQNISVVTGCLIQKFSNRNVVIFGLIQKFSNRNVVIFAVTLYNI